MNTGWLTTYGVSWVDWVSKFCAVLLVNLSNKGCKGPDILVAPTKTEVCAPEDIVSPSSSHKTESKGTESKGTERLKKRGSGGLTQLICYADQRTFCQFLKPTGLQLGTCCSSQDECSTWFLGQESGLPSVKEVYPVFEEQALYYTAIPITDAVFSVKKDRSACKIQKAWRTAICDPKHLICQKRLVGEFMELIEQ